MDSNCSQKRAQHFLGNHVGWGLRLQKSMFLSKLAVWTRWPSPWKKTQEAASLCWWGMWYSSLIRALTGPQGQQPLGHAAHGESYQGRASNEGQGSLPVPLSLQFTTAEAMFWGIFGKTLETVKERWSRMQLPADEFLWELDTGSHTHRWQMLL